VSVRRRTAFAIVAAGLAFACAGLIAISASPFVSGAGWIALVTASIVLPFAVAAGLYLRFPRRVLPTLLVAIGITYFIRSLTAIDSGVTYGPARALALLSEVLLVWLMLAFPSGTLPRPWSRALIVWGGAVVMLLWLGAIATSREYKLLAFMPACTSSIAASAPWRWIACVMRFSAGTSRSSHRRPSMYGATSLEGCISTSSVLTTPQPPSAFTPRMAA